MIPDLDLRAIDPLALILSPEIYVRLHLPDPPPEPVVLAQARQVASALKGQDRAAVLARAKVLGAYANALQQALR